MNYQTVGEIAEYRLTIERSVFISNVKRVTTPEQARAFLEEIRKKYSDATHNVYAFRLCDGTVKCSDDREPSGTAGMPVLEVIKGEDLYDVICVVTRYFGGIKLGTGGLARAYARTAKEGLAGGKKLTSVYSDIYKVSLTYEQYPAFQAVFKKGNLTEEEKEFSNGVDITFSCEHGFDAAGEITAVLNKSLPISLLKECYLLK